MLYFVGMGGSLNSVYSDIFTDEAIEVIYRFSGGSSRLVNKACRSALIYGYQNGKRIIDDHMVKLVISGE